MTDSNREAAADEAVRGLLEALPEPALVVRGGAVALANSAARSLLGRWIEGEDVRLAFRHPAAVQRLAGGGADPEGETELVGLGGIDRRWRMRVAAIGGGALLVRLTDRSESEAAERMRVDFVANASHELRTPLATLLGYAETLCAEDSALDPATRLRFLAVVRDEARRMQRLVEDLISLSRIESERFSAPTQRLSLPALAEEALANAAAAAAERGSQLRLDSEPDLPAVAGDRAQLLQLIDNLVANAIRYGREGGPVAVELARAGDMVRLTVADEGEGIAPEHVPRLTERFYRADPGRSRALGGTGLGLAIVKHIVERHRGRLDIDSVVGRGTAVHVLLPSAGAAAAES